MQNNRRTNQQSLLDDDDYDDQVQPTKRFRPNVDNKNIIEVNIERLAVFINF